MFHTFIRVFVKICGVSILRAGEALEDALVSVSKDVKIGKILIQTNKDTYEPEVVCDSLIDPLVRLFIP